MKPVLVGDDVHPTRKGLEELALPEKEGRIRRSAVALIALGKRVVDQDAVLGDRVYQAAEQRAVQVVDDDDPVEAAARKRPGRILEIGFDDLDAIVIFEVGET